jgi:PAS domain S-box-containing protein
MNQPATILVVDDSATNRETLRELLDTKDYRFVEAADGATALRLAAEAPPDLVLLDVVMPNMDGYEVCRRLRADSRLAEVPIIIITALDDQASRLAGLEAGADDFVTNPFNRAELRARVHSVTRLNRYRRLMETQATLRESEERYQKMLMLSPDAHFVHVDGLITFVNQTFCRLMGAAGPAQLLGRPAEEAFHPDYRELVRERQQKILNDQPTPPFEIKLIRLDGISVDVEVASIAFDFRGHKEIQVIARDITERKRHDAHFLQAQKMEALGQFSGGIAHDFNNILSAIVGYSQLSQLILKENPEVRGHIGAVLKAADRATALVQQILTFSRRQPEERHPINLLPIVTESIELLRATIPAGIEFDTSVATDTPTVLANAGQIHQILMNLGINAWHAMKDLPGRLQVKLERCVVDATHAASQPRLQPGVYARISVSDTGSGMEPATLRRIFEPFFTTRLPGEGTGLGLAVVHGIMDSHDGAVTVYSQPGEGSIFHLYFPAYAGVATVAAAVAEDGPVPRGHGERILVVDDEELLTQLGQKTLVELGYEVETTTLPVAALALVRANPRRFALVLTDQAMPGLTGILLASQLRQIRPELPIILMTGYSVSLTTEVLKTAGVRQLLLKPINLHSLGTAVHEALAVKLTT